MHLPSPREVDLRKSRQRELTDALNHRCYNEGRRLCWIPYSGSVHVLNGRSGYKITYSVAGYEVYSYIYMEKPKLSEVRFRWLRAYID